MRKLITLGLVFATAVLLYGQPVAMDPIEVEGSPQVCAGYTSANQIRVRVRPTKTMDAAAGHYMLAYIWTAEHANGTKVWFSNQPARWVPIPWPGQYRVSVKVEYIMPGSTRPFRVSSFGGVFLYGMDCGTP